MKLLSLQRPAVCGDKATIGRLSINGVFQCLTLEDVDRRLENGGEKIPCQTAIPRGRYRVIIDYSAHFNKSLPHVMDVPGFVGVRIHPGNTDKDTEGCILVGDQQINDDFISNSRLAFDRLFEILTEALAHGEDIVLEIA